IGHGQNCDAAREELVGVHGVALEDPHARDEREQHEQRAEHPDARRARRHPDLTEAMRRRIRARSRREEKKSRARTFEPGTSVHVRSGISQTICPAWSRAEPIKRARISTSNIQRLRNGSSKTAHNRSDTRNSFAPHCVSETGAPSTSQETAGPHTRPRERGS